MSSAFGKRSYENGVFCQSESETEAVLVRNFQRFGHQVSRAPSFTTSLGRYTPDFQVDDILVEVKSPGSWGICCGRKAFFKDARDDRLGTPTNKQLLKMLELAQTQKFVVVILQRGEKATPSKLVNGLEIIDIHRFLLAQPTFDLYNIILRRHMHEIEGHQQV